MSLTDNESLTDNGNGDQTDDKHRRIRRNVILWILIGAQIGVYTAFTILSQRFEFHTPFHQRPILTFLTLMGLAFVLHFASFAWERSTPNQSRVVRHVFIGSIVFRALVLPSHPIQEVDIYRYLWDGTVVANGQNPYSYSPHQILNVAANQNAGPQVKQIAKIRAQEPSSNEALKRIHFGGLITVYPPVSQAVFGAASLLVPRQASLYQRLVTMKLILILFDLGVLWLLIQLLTRLRIHVAWSILYGWSPLVLKEFSNSGHLDSIAVFFTMAAIVAAVQALDANKPHLQVAWLTGSCLLLGLGVGAKLFPVILIPVLAAMVWRNFGFRLCVGFASLSSLSSALALAPMLLTEPATIATTPIITSPEKPLQPQTSSSSNDRAGSGLAAFLSSWEINDFLFMFAVENLRPDIVENAVPTNSTDKRIQPHWFVVVPQSLRLALADSLANTSQQTPFHATFLFARALTLLVFLAILCGLVTQGCKANTLIIWLRVSFLTIAWFWALSPTLNPWYWTWALPLVPFSGRRTWCLVSLLVLGYYLRFLFLYHPAYAELLDLGYRGENFFHFVVVPLEHIFWLLLLAFETLVSQPLNGSKVVRKTLPI